MSFEQDAGRSLGRGDQAPMGPSPPYPQSTGAQFPASNFQYTHSDYPSLDGDLNMPEAFSHPQSMASQLQEAAGGVNQRNGDINAISVNTNGSVSAGMGPPQTPHQSSFSPTGPRASVDETPDSATPAEDSNKRRRSKVSRACDECRRKKIKCDSADTPDGTIKTCSNCAKSNMTCEFSRVPMKRGPSKGYIKELSERVEKMESRQLAMGQPGYRQSFDGTMTDSLYSPDDPMSARRQFSFSSDARNPFAPTDYERERMPSAGGAWSSEFSPGILSRDRGSLALAPDQRLPALSSNSRVLFPDDLDHEQPPAKRRKTGESTAKMHSVYLTNYYDSIHPEFPVLPHVSTQAATWIDQADGSDVFEAFSTIIGSLPSSRPANDLQSNGKPEALLQISEQFSTAAELDNFLKDFVITEQVHSRSPAENLLCLWSYMLLALLLEFDVRPVRADTRYATRTRLLDAAQTLSAALITQEATNDDPDYRNNAQQVNTLAQLMSRLELFAAGPSELSRVPNYKSVDYSIFADNPEVSFMVKASGGFKILKHLIQSGIHPADEFTLLARTDTIELMLFNALSTTGVSNSLTENSLFVRKVFEFVKLVMAPYKLHPQAPTVILESACRLINYLEEDAPAAGSRFHYSPLDYYLFTAAVLTIIGVLIKVPNVNSVSISEAALARVKPILEQKIKIFRDGINTREDEGHKFPGWYGKDTEGNDIRNITWMESLLKAIERNPKEKWAISKQEAEPYGGQAGRELPAGMIALVRDGYGTLLRTWAHKEFYESSD